MPESTTKTRTRRRRRPLGYSATKAAHFATYLLIKGGPEMSKLKLAKLLYLGERRSAETYGHMMFFDRHVAAEHGPIPSMCLNGIDGRSDKKVWSRHVDTVGNVVRARHTVSLADLDHLSQADREIADGLLETFGWMSASQIRQWTHDNLPEYREKEARLSKETRSVDILPLDMARGFAHPTPEDFVEIDAEMRSIAEI